MKTYTISEIAQVFDGPHATPKRQDSGHYFLNISSLSRGRLDLDLSDHVSDEDFAKWTRRVTPLAGDLLFSYETRLGEAALMPEGVTACLGRRMGLLRPNRNLVDPRFLLYFYLAPPFQKLIEQNTIHGATVNRIPLNSMGSWSVRLPPLPEQQAIAEVLGALDDKIAANLALAGLIDEYLAGLLEKITHGTGTTSLRAIADVNRQSVRPEVGRQLRYVDIASVGVGTFEYPGVSDWADAPGRARRGLAAGDTVWSTVRPNRRSHALNLEDDPMLVASTGLAVLSPRTVGFAYLYESTRRPEFTSFLENVAEGSAYPAVRADRFLEAPVPDLPATSIRRFEDTAAPLRELVAVQARENRTLGATRDALLPQLMSGKLRVRDAEAMAFTAGATTPTGANDEC